MRPVLPAPCDAPAGVATAEQAGPAPSLQWCRIDQLVVDPAYQRDIGRAGLKNIQTIAREFNWAAFSPVVVSPVPGGLFAIVDGQHRTTAAALVGFEQVPCMVVMATTAAQAKAFSAINQNTTKMHSMAAHWAAVAAGDALALRINAVAGRANVTILHFPVQTLMQQPGQTMAVGAIGAVIKAHGDEIAVQALRLIRETPLNNERGMLLSHLIRANGEVIALLGIRGKHWPAILDAFGRIKLIREFDHASRENREKGGGILPLLIRRLLTRAYEKMEKAA